MTRLWMIEVSGHVVSRQSCDESCEPCLYSGNAGNEQDTPHQHIKASIQHHQFTTQQTDHSSLKLELYLIFFLNQVYVETKSVHS